MYCYSVWENVNLCSRLTVVGDGGGYSLYKTQGMKKRIPTFLFFESKGTTVVVDTYNMPTECVSR